ncbi:GTP pyrophosphokinase [Thiohalobacter sp. COW1]|uniref:GTP diphosphokinase n=1 Tax=Thiohalobacter sp. COW1 TaxID=2795687 RepID=UPI0019357AF3|nr:GTP pyrophosphokinase [Thiohalobacter sp. COW1]
MVSVSQTSVQATTGREDPDPAQYRAALTLGFSEEGRGLIERAVDYAVRAHAGQRRASGEPYLSHVLAVAEIVHQLGLDHESVCAAILHDVVEDTPVTLDEVRSDFGPAIARLVDGVTKMGQISRYRDAAQKAQEHAESLRKLLLAMAEDIRVILVKLADRLHNMRTLRHLETASQRRIARETLELYAPLANRLGIGQIKWELEDLSLRYLEPGVYKEIATHLDERRLDRERYIDHVVVSIRNELQAAGIQGEVSGRVKHIYSIWRKMQRKNVGFNEIFDVRAVRILVERVADCYAALGVVHSMWHHIPREFDDYIANPKENNYRSLHTAVVGPGGRTLEIQIRTREMHEHAELGVAAHWRYKEGGRFDQSFEQKIAWLRQLIEWRDEESTASDFVDRFKSETGDRVYVLTPQGQVVDLPQGATPLDFAYHIHTEIGHRCRGAKIDGQIVPLTYELHNGEQVEILTTRNGTPSRDWLSPHLGYLKSSRARAKVRHWFHQQDRDKNLAAGRAVLERELDRLGLDNMNWEELARRLRFDNVQDLLVAIGKGDIGSTQIVSAANDLFTREEEAIPLSRPSSRGEEGGDVRILGVGNLLTHMARCCHPVPQDPIVGYITRGRGVTIHRRDCPNVLRLYQHEHERLIEVSWGGSQQRVYPVDIQILAYDRSGLLRDITSVLATEKINVLGVNTVTDKHDHAARMKLSIEISDLEELSRVLTRIGQLPNVIEARRELQH